MSQQHACYFRLLKLGTSYGSNYTRNRVRLFIVIHLIRRTFTRNTEIKKSELKGLTENKLNENSLANNIYHDSIKK